MGPIQEEDVHNLLDQVESYSATLREPRQPQPKKDFNVALGEPSDALSPGLLQRLLRVTRELELHHQAHLLMQSLMPVIYMEPEWLEQVGPPDGELCSRRSGPLRRPVANTSATACHPKHD
ncbi:hypothetical protein MNEG_4592 [Monoraphidium neglectum]|jgi:hypothetical protein|uniref:Uncharacterized protein n=1 Tax=Monoraphidium neglectum TaxID=145388 RepID=A0A0D2JXJ7_9CHLO|nr:hypothetical protein MNEG_4592 [Monoraphidium neglectum]KIZ03368.1 hypothetical protein MNEG_4592 [Monoraphidium neglectum]|eukprot:XP_013902387.1 hypothetical protein MNEG_4592 [Monoraphidium neglectum]